MINGDKMTALEQVIYLSAKSQFAVNQVSPAEARLIMKAVSERFSEACLEQFVMERVSMKPQESSEPQKTETRTGSAEELMQDFRKTGFTCEREVEVE